MVSESCCSYLFLFWRYSTFFQSIDSEIYSLVWGQNQISVLQLSVMNINVQQQQQQHSPGEYLEVQDKDTKIQWATKIPDKIRLAKTLKSTPNYSYLFICLPEHYIFFSSRNKWNASLSFPLRFPYLSLD